MPVWIPWLKVNQQNKGSGKGESEGKNGSSGGKGWGGKGGYGKDWGQSDDWQGAWMFNEGKGKGKHSTRKPPQAVPESFQVNPDTRYTGTVRIYKKWSGFGFVELSQKGVIPEDSVYVNWRSIQTEDRFPQLAQGMECELSLMKVKDKASGTWTLKAKNLTAPGGGPVSVQDDADAKMKEFVGGQHLRYTGHLQSFSPERGFGWLTMDDGYALTEPIPKELRVDLPEVNAGGRQPSYMKDIAVEFGVVKGRRGGYKAYNMTLPGGIPMTQEGLEHRVVMGTRTYAGIVEMYNWSKGWGFIKAAPGVAFPPNVMAKIKEHWEDLQKRGKKANSTDPMLYFRKEDISEGVQLEETQQVTFKVYTDDKGAGACEIH